MKGFSHLRRFAALVFAVCLPLAGCNRPADEDEGRTDAPAETAADSLPATSPRTAGADPAATDAQDDAADPRVVSIDVSEWVVELDRDTIRYGTNTFVFRNQGERVHTLEIRGPNGERWRTVPVAPGRSASLRFSIGPGRFRVVSIDPVYIRRGMFAELEVVE